MAGGDLMRNQSALSNIQKVELFVNGLISKDRGPYKNSIATLDEIEASCRRILNDITKFRESKIETLNTDANADDSKSISESRLIVSGYAKALKCLSEQDVFTPMVSDFTRCLWRWYEARILNNQKYTKFSKSFMYKPGNIRNWIYALVIYYGWCCEQGCTHVFHEMMDKFISDLGNDEKTTCFYPIPYIPSQISRHHGDQYANLTAVYLWEAIYDNGLDTMSDPNLYKKASVGASSVSSLVDSMSPGILDNYDSNSSML